MFMPCPATYFLEKYHFWCYYSKSKTEDFDQGSWFYSVNVRTFLFILATYLLEVSARVSLKVGTNSPFRGKRFWKIGSFDVKEKRKSVIKVTYTFWSFKNIYISSDLRDITDFTSFTYSIPSKKVFRGKKLWTFQVLETIILKRKGWSVKRTICILGIHLVEFN